MDERKPLNHREMVAMETIYALQAKAKEIDCLEKRMKELGVWAKYKPAMALLTKTVRALLDSLPDRNLRHMEDVRTKYFLRIMPLPIVGKTSSDHVISTEDLQVLCNSTQREMCRLCIKSGREVKKCRLRNVFLQIAPPDEIKDGGLCEYAMLKSDGDDFFDMDEEGD